MSKNNNIQALWLALSSLSALGISILSAVILSRYFSKNDYGSYRQLIYIYNTMLVVFSAGLPRVYSYFLPRYPLSQGKSIARKMNIMLFVFGLIFGLTLFMFSDFISVSLNNSDLSYGLKLFAVVPVFLLPTLGVEGIFSTYKKTKYVAIYNTISRLQMLGFIVLPIIVFDLDYIYSIYGWIISSFLNFIIAIYFKNIPFKGIEPSKVDLSNLDILKYSFPLGLASIFSMAISSSDQFFISRYFGAEEFAEFSNRYMELPFVGMITFSIGAVIMPILSKMNHDKSDVNEILKLWSNSLLKSATIIYPLVVFFIFSSKDVMTIMFTENYTKSSTYFCISLLRNFFNVILFAPLLLSIGKNRIYLNLHITYAIIAWIGGYLIVFVFDSPFAIALFASFRSILLTITSFYIVSKIMGIRLSRLFPINKLSVILFHSVISILISSILLNFIFLEDTKIFKVIISFILFLLILVSTSQFFKLLHFSILKEFYIKIKHKIK